jgi:hypothetical protein
MKQVMLCIIAILFITSVHAQQQTDNDNTAKFPAAGVYTNTKLTYKIIDAANKTFGYDVYANGKLMIHQKSIPAMPGNEGFKTKSDAGKVAQLVINKIKKGEMPPTVSVEEMKKLNVIK